MEPVMQQPIILFFLVFVSIVALASAAVNACTLAIHATNESSGGKKV
jgi:hypothetical protein